MILRKLHDDDPGEENDYVLESDSVWIEVGERTRRKRLLKLTPKGYQIFKRL